MNNHLKKNINFTIEQLDMCLRLTYEAYKEEVNVLEESKKNIQCPPYFDGILCWPNTDANQEVIQSCPPVGFFTYYHIIFSSDRTNMTIDNATVTQTCQEDGSWRLDYLGKNYDMCVPRDSFAYLLLMISDTWKYLWNLADLKFTKDWSPTVVVISYIGYATTFAAMILATMIFSLFKKLRNPPNKLHMNLFASFIIKTFMILLRYWTNSAEGIEPYWSIIEYRTTFLEQTSNIKYYHYQVLNHNFFKILWNYSIMANYLWMLMEGLYLWKLIFFPMSDTSKITLYIVAGLPCLITLVWCMMHSTAKSWSPMYEDRSLYMCIVIPIAISILLNFLLFFCIVYNLYVKLRTSGHLQRQRMKYKRWAKSAVILIPLFGAHYLIFMALTYYDDKNVKIVSIHCYQVFTAFQGAFIALHYCLLNDEVRFEIRHAWRTHWSKLSVWILGRRRLSNNRRREDNQHVTSTNRQG